MPLRHAAGHQTRCCRLASGGRPGRSIRDRGGTERAGTSRAPASRARLRARSGGAAGRPGSVRTDRLVRLRESMTGVPGADEPWMPRDGSIAAEGRAALCALACRGRHLQPRMASEWPRVRHLMQHRAMERGAPLGEQLKAALRALWISPKAVDDAEMGPHPGHTHDRAPHRDSTREGRGKPAELC